MITPPVAANGVIHSAPAVRAVAVLYCRVAVAPYAKLPVKVIVAVPSIERMPLTVVVPVGNVFAPLLLNVR